MATGAGTPLPQATRSGPALIVDQDDARTGLTLIAPHEGDKATLIDDDGMVVHTWNFESETTGRVELLDDGRLLRSRSGAQGQPDGVEILDWDGAVLWEYTPPEPFQSHHDCEYMPNGNVLLNTKVFYSETQIVGKGRDPDLVDGDLASEPIIEVRPNGTSDGDIVWMWDPLDHVIQDYSPEYSNYGIVSDHPELLDINYPSEYKKDWLHTNSVSYNPELDQIMITGRNFDEFWVIDHNTTTEEAAGHTGGAHGRGGDLLYRWGNPGAYGAGDASDHILWGPHDAHWIDPGYPGEGNIIVFNNGMNLFATRPEGEISTVEELVPPQKANGAYLLEPGSPYGPPRPLWTYEASPPEDFFAWAMGGVERLPDGHTLVCGGSFEVVFEVDAKGKTVWQHRSGSIFRAHRYYPPALEAVPPINVTEDVLQVFKISTFLSDLDTDLEDIELSENSSYVNVSGHDLHLLYPEGITSEVVGLTVSDGVLGTEWDLVINVTPLNDPPEIEPIPQIKAVEDTPRYIDLGEFVRDPDSAPGELIINASSPYASVDGMWLTLLYPEGILTDRFLLTVSDGEFVASTEVEVRVTPVNDPPTVGLIPDQRAIEDVPIVVYLGSYLFDMDSPWEQLFITTSSVHASVSGLNLTLQYPNGVVRDVVHVTVSDGQARTDGSFNVTVEPVNDPPGFGELQPFNVTEDESFSRNIASALVDVDTPLEELTLETDSPYVEVERHFLTLLYPEGVLHDLVELGVSDGEFTTYATVVVNVEPVNDPPGWTPLPVITAVEGEEGEFDLSPYIQDIDTPISELTVRVDSNYGHMDGHVFVFTYPGGVTVENVVFTLSDGEHAVPRRTNVTVSQAEEPHVNPVEPRLHPPSILVLEVPLDATALGDTVTILAKASDPDSPFQELTGGVVITLPDRTVRGNSSMRYNQSTDAFTFEFTPEVEGEHSVTVWVGDADDNWASRSTSFVVGPRAEPPPADVDRAGQPVGPWLALVALMAFVAAILVVMKFRYRQGDRELRGRTERR